MLTPAPCDTRPGSRSCSAWYIAGRLGHRERSLAWIARQIQLLIDHEGFPPPIVRFAGDRRVDAIGHASRWNLEAVDAWFDGNTVPAALAPAVSSLAAARDAALLDQRAKELVA